MCGSNQIKKAGFNAHGICRYCCEYLTCPTKSFMLTYRSKAYEPGIKKTVIKRAINSSVIRDTTCLLV